MGTLFYYLFRCLCSVLMYELGRPVMIKDEDFETPLPNVDPVSFFLSESCLLYCNLNHFQNEDRQPWQPTLTKDNLPYPPVPGRVMNAFCATSRLGKSFFFPVHTP